MRQIFVIALSIFLSHTVFAQTWTPAGTAAPEPATVSLLTDGPQSSQLKASISGFSSTTVLTPAGPSQIIGLEGSTRILRKGAPDLPKLTTSLIIPDQAAMEVVVTNSSYVEYTNIDIAPSKGNFTRDINPDDVPYEWGSAYSKNQFYPGPLAELNDPFILRDLRGQTVVLYPFQYNPVTRVLRVYTTLEVSIIPGNGTPVNAFYRDQAFSAPDPEFAEIYRHHFLNYNTGNKYTVLGESGKMLIICHSSFMSAMQPFVDWKITRGVPTEMVDVSTIGTTAAAIKTYVSNYYNTNGLAFLLLVGDAAQIPTNATSNGDSDPTYGFIVGNDHYQDILVGRFSAENVTDVTTQVTRTINYEKNPSTTTGKFNHCIGIGSSQGPGDDSEYDYAHIRNINNDLLGFTYSTQAELYEGSQGGEDLAGDPSAANLTTQINRGASIITYCGHGSDNSFVTTGFSNSNMSSLINTDVQPFIWSVACVNGNFTAGTCFAEGWLRQTYNGQPAGAIATLMSTINQSWNPPMEGQDEMVDILTESIAGNIKRTFGGLSVNGIFKMNDTYSDYAMTDTWTLFGDPSLLVRTDDPAPMTASHSPILPIGSSSLTVNCNVEGAFVCISMNNLILGTGYINGGSVNISFSPLTSIDTLTVCATAFNYVPYLGSVLVNSATGPWVAYTSNTVNDASGNTNGKVDFGESIQLNINLHNYGSQTATAVSAALASADGNITITDNSQTFGDIASSADASQTGAYAFSVVNNIADQHAIPFTLAVQDNAGGSWPANFTLIANAPALAVGAFGLNDATGNNNGALDEGETLSLSIATLNNGHADAPACTGVLTTSTPQYITINSGNHSFGTLAQASSANAGFSVTIASDVPDTEIIQLTYTVTSGAYSVSTDYYLTVGLVSEDWETGDFSQFGWIQGGNVPWYITTANPYEGVDCAVSGNINDDQTSTLSVSLDVLINDTISFWKKVSCEQDFDFLSFYIDGTLMNQWSGTIAWSKEAYPVTAGTHIFRWEYAKDYMVSSGSDCAWVDYILFPPSTSEYAGLKEEAVAANFLRCFPNPASNQTTIEFFLAEPAPVILALYDLTGRCIKTILPGIEETNGLHSLSFNTADLDAGLYYFRLSTENQHITHKLIITN